MDNAESSPAMSTALIPLETRRWGQNADPALQARVERTAAASGVVPPTLLPGAAALILPVHLPVKTDRQRRAALPFAVEPHLAAPLEHVVLALGPRMSEHDWQCVVAARAQVEALTAEQSGNSPILPETLAVPLPRRPEAWGLWCGIETCFIRLADGTGFAVAPDHISDIWRIFGAPPIDLFHGPVPPGIVADRHDPPALDPAVLGVDLGTTRRSRPRGWAGLGRFAMVTALIAALSQIALLRADAVFLARMVEDRTAALQDRLDGIGLTIDAKGPAGLIERALSRVTRQDTTAEPFLSQLASSFAALPQDQAIGLRDLRYDESRKALILQLEAADLQSLQMVEDALVSAGLSATSGAARQNETGAEMQIVISEGV